jgi:hypothetical protein
MPERRNEARPSRCSGQRTDSWVFTLTQLDIGFLSATRRMPRGETGRYLVVLSLARAMRTK